MTDNEIIKALKELLEMMFHDGEWQRSSTISNTINLINRQKAEIERLEKEIKDKERVYNDEFCLRKEWQTKCRELLKEKQIIKSEAIKDFAERLKRTITNAIDTYYNLNGGGYYLAEDTIDDIDILVKEMTEENENDR